ncbi:unnamed protein product [Blepharisma stoltei]|uniref:Uncharacterized protein n=1 Tax=Blepharisma stoltei TaxID=1481888 RepID=A0AAU9K3H6_9CILI|nr:unnamed protein product [Blepharisma stoltei]
MVISTDHLTKKQLIIPEKAQNSWKCLDLSFNAAILNNFLIYKNMSQMFCLFIIFLSDYKITTLHLYI